MTAGVSGVGVARAISHPTGDRVGAAQFEDLSEDVAGCHVGIIASVPPGRARTYGFAMRQVGFIRAVMVGREGLHREVILDIFRRAGAGDPRSHLATGNVSFDLRPAELPSFVEVVDERLTGVVGRKIEVFVRSLDALRQVDADAIYGTAPFEQVEGRLVTYFHDTPDFGDVDVPGLIQKGRTALLAVDGADVYSVIREVDGQMGSPGGLLEKLSGQRVTTRAWRTVQKVIEANETL